jgi:hypothetical protein
LVACGYSQIPGVDFNKSFAVVINDVRFCVILIITLTWGLQATIIDVETASEHGNLSVTFASCLKTIILEMLEKDLNLNLQ